VMGWNSVFFCPISYPKFSYLGMVFGWFSSY
jgi:hypothetical protein